MIKVSAEPASTRSFMKSPKASAMKKPPSAVSWRPMASATMTKARPKQATVSESTSRVPPVPRNTPSISRIMPATARKTSGSAAAIFRSGIIWALLARRPEVGEERRPGLRRRHRGARQRRLVALDQPLHRGCHDVDEGRRIDAHPQHQDNQRREHSLLPPVEVAARHEVVLGYPAEDDPQRSEERRVGTECVSQGRCR